MGRRGPQGQGCSSCPVFLLSSRNDKRLFCLLRKRCCCCCCWQAQGSRLGLWVLASQTGPEEPLCPWETHWPHPCPWEVAAQESQLHPAATSINHLLPLQRAETQAREVRRPSLSEAVGGSGISLYHGIHGRRLSGGRGGMAVDARGSLSPCSLSVKPPVKGDTVVPTSLIPVSTNGRGLLQPEGRGPWSAI